MASIKLFSWLAIIIIIVAAAFSLKSYHTVHKPVPVLYTTKNYDTMTRTLERIRLRNIQIPGETISKNEYNAQITQLQQQVNALKSQSAKQVAAAPPEKDLSMQTFWVKVVFSGIFCLAALFVVLSKKYDDETKKWAFSILTLIAGVWIGTIA